MCHIFSCFVRIRLPFFWGCVCCKKIFFYTLTVKYGGTFSGSKKNAVFQSNALSHLFPSGLYSWQCSFWLKFFPQQPRVWLDFRQLLIFETVLYMFRWVKTVTTVTRVQFLSFSPHYNFVFREFSRVFSTRSYSLSVNVFSTFWNYLVKTTIWPCWKTKHFRRNSWNTELCGKKVSEIIL